MSVTKMTASLLNAAKGWPRPHGLDFHAQLSANVTFSPPAGRVLHLNSSGQYETGIGNVDMALFLFPNVTDPDIAVSGGGDPATDAGAFLSAVPKGEILTIVAVGAVELCSTEYVAGSYPPGTTLTAPVANSTLATGGKLVAGIVGTNPICGVVSRGLADNGYGTTGLWFWPVYMPIAP